MPITAAEAESTDPSRTQPDRTRAQRQAKLVGSPALRLAEVSCLGRMQPLTPVCLHH